MKRKPGMVPVVTGAGGGLGSGLAKVLAERGLRFVLADIEECALERCSNAFP